jgi:hypothetical protein
MLAMAPLSNQEDNHILNLNMTELVIGTDEKVKPRPVQDMIFGPAGQRLPC